MADTTSAGRPTPALGANIRGRITRYIDQDWLAGAAVGLIFGFALAGAL